MKSLRKQESMLFNANSQAKAINRKGFQRRLKFIHLLPQQIFIDFCFCAKHCVKLWGRAKKKKKSPSSVFSAELPGVETMCVAVVIGTWGQECEKHTDALSEIVREAA